ncbi:MAG: HAD family hydrolase [Chloroflexota bacterium]|nr:HAD family hydrolase [Chloroflexota bacterium]
MHERSFDRDRLKGIVFDLDGTLYDQDTLRRAMLLRLARAHAWRPLHGLRTLRVLSAYRKAQEHLRESTTLHSEPVNLARAQIRLACERTQAEASFVEECVTRWMEQAPLPLMARSLHPGVLEFLHACKSRGLRLGVLSDYPADAKLEALGLAGFFEVVLAAQSAEVGAFKPHPRGLLMVMQRLQISASECLYVGDRAEVDAAVAVAAGVVCAIMTRGVDARKTRPWMQVAGYPRLHEIVLGEKHRLNRPSTSAERVALPGQFTM